MKKILLFLFLILFCAFFSDAQTKLISSTGKLITVGNGLNVSANTITASGLPTATGNGKMLIVDSSGAAAWRYKNVGTRTFNVLDYGANGYDTLDDAAAIIAAMNAADRAGGGEVFFPIGHYYVKTALASGWNCQICLPLSSSYDTLKRIVFRGEMWPNTTEMIGTNSKKAESGVIIESTNATGSNVSPLPAVIGSKYFNDGLSNINYTQFGIYDMEIRVRTNNGNTHYANTLGGINAFYMSTFAADNIKCSITSTLTDCVVPSVWTYGLMTPAFNNRAFSSIGRLDVVGYYTGLYINEHSLINEYVAAACAFGVEVGRDGHRMSIIRAQLEGVAHGFHMKDPSDDLTVFSYGAEQHAGSHWYDYIDDAYFEGGNHAYGSGGNLYIHEAHLTASTLGITGRFLTNDSSRVTLDINTFKHLDMDTVSLTGTAPQWNTFSSRKAYLKLTGNTALDVRYIKPGETVTLIAQQDATGGRTLSITPGTNDFVMPTGANAKAVITGTNYGGGTIWTGLGAAAGGSGGGTTVADSATAKYSFSESSGTRADGSGNGHDLTEHGTVPRVNGFNGYAVSFNGSSANYLSTAGFYGGGADLSVSFWMKANTTIGGGTQTPICAWQNGKKQFVVNVINTGTVQFTVCNDGGSTTDGVTTPYAIDLDWHYITCGLHNGYLYIAVDGQNEVFKQCTFSTIYMGGMSDIELGTIHDQAGSYEFTGLVAQPRIYVHGAPRIIRVADFNNAQGR